MLTGRKNILTVWGKGQGFPVIGPLPTFWPFMVSFGTVMAPVGGCVISMLIYYNERIMRLKVNWKSDLSPSWV